MASGNNPSGGVFEFTNTPPSDANYTLVGFEIYYKLYNPSAGLVTSQYVTDTSQFNPNNAPQPSPTVAMGLGYRRLMQALAPSAYTGSGSSGSSGYGTPPGTYGAPVSQSTLSATAWNDVSVLQQPPLIPIPIANKQTLFTMALDFTPALSTATTNNAVAAPTFYSTGGTTITFSNSVNTGATIQCVRYVTQTAQTYLKGFGLDDFAIPDEVYDLPTSYGGVTGTGPISISGGIGVGILVFAYGLDPNLATVYSIPVALGSTTLTGVTAIQSQ